MGAVMRGDLAGLTFAEFKAWCAGIAGHSERFHRALYRDVMGSGIYDPARLPAWQEAERNKPGVIAELMRHAAPSQCPEVSDVREAFDPATGRTLKILTRLEDGLTVESVAIPMRLSDGQPSRYTACVSSQVGCKMGCTFCQTAKMGLVRQLEPHEIVGQLLAIRAATGIAPRNVVFMGMGEPLDNIKAVAHAVQVMTDRNGLGLAAKHITISTVGRVDGIARMNEAGLGKVNLAVSLTATNDALRSSLMPVNRVYDLAALKQALLDYAGPERRKILISYVLMAGRNDSVDDARDLVAWLSGLEAQVNLIPLNRTIGCDDEASDQTTTCAFRDILDAAAIPVRLRTTKGDAVMAACGQLGVPRKVGSPNGAAKSARLQ
jgi:23S rRNA (adenine2503-C2)-methyltransferase